MHLKANYLKIDVKKECQTKSRKIEAVNDHSFRSRL
jgi:hypothetical protein